MDIATVIIVGYMISLFTMIILVWIFRILDLYKDFQKSLKNH